MRIDSAWLRLSVVAVCCITLGYGLGAMHQYGKAVAYANEQIAELCPPTLQGMGGVPGYITNNPPPYIGVNASTPSIPTHVGNGSGGD